MWELDHEESWAPKNWCFWTVVLEKTLESALDCKEIKPVHPKGNQSWIIIGRTDAEAEAPILWPPNMKSWLTGKDLDAGKDWRQENGTTEDEMVGWHHWLSGHEFEQALGDGKGQGSLACCSPSGREELDMTDQPNNNRNVYVWLIHFPQEQKLIQHCNYTPIKIFKEEFLLNCRCILLLRSQDYFFFRVHDFCVLSKKMLPTL